ncbi:MAG: hypothetical protein HGB05_08695 [Chloroflexi bacterium]|nr:hypothetical protein [Chloroflexota bacterium]
MPIGFFEKQGVLAVPYVVGDLPFGNFVMFEAKPQAGEFVGAEEESNE